MSNLTNARKKNAEKPENWQGMMRAANVAPALFEPTQDGRMIQEIPVDQIRPSSQQVRTQFDTKEMAELAASIKEHGVLQPIKVISRLEKDPHFELIYGERRWRACQQAGLTTIPATVVSAQQVDEKDQAIQGLIENLQRADLAPLDTLKGLENLKQMTGASWYQLARLTGKSRSTIYRYRALGQLPSEVQQMVNLGQLNLKQATALVNLDKPEEQKELAKIAADDNLPGEALESVVKSIKAGKKVETAVVHAARRHLADPPPSKPAREESHSEPPEEDLNTQFQVEDQTQGLTSLHKSKMKGLTEEQYEDLSYVIDAHKLTIPTTYYAAAIMRLNPTIGAAAAAIYADLFNQNKKLSEPVRSIRYYADIASPHFDEHLGRAERITSIAFFTELEAWVREIKETLMAADAQAKESI